MTMTPPCTDDFPGSNVPRGHGLYTGLGDGSLMLAIAGALGGKRGGVPEGDLVPGAVTKQLLLEDREVGGDGSGRIRVLFVMVAMRSRSRFCLRQRLMTVMM